MSHGHNALVFTLTRRRPPFLSSFTTLALRLPRPQPVFTRDHASPLFLVEGPAERLHTPLIPSTSTSIYTPGSLNVARSRPPPVSNHPPSKTGHSAIHILQRFLSPENVTSQHPLTYSPSYVRSLYYMAESENQLGQLDSKALTVLIGLFGSLSIDSNISVVYRVPLAFHPVGPSTRTHWCFVLKLGRYKLQNKISLQDSDRFWLMRAELANAEASSRSERTFLVVGIISHLEDRFIVLSNDARKAISRARIHYHIIRRHTRHPEVHAVYFETLLATRDPQLLDIAASDLSYLLRTHTVWHPRLLRVFCRLVIQHGGGLSTRSQDSILSALWNRVCRTNRKSKLATTHGQDSHCLLDATALARSLSGYLSGTLSSLSSTGLFDYLFPVFSLTQSRPARWSSLVFFAIFNASETLRANGVVGSPEYTMPLAVSCWQVIFGLATIEKMLHQPLSRSEGDFVTAEDVLETTRTLYHSWLPIVKANNVPRDITGAIATSFLKIASLLADDSFFHNCRALYNMTSFGPTHTLPVPLARYGALEEAIRFLDDRRFSAEERGVLVHAIARNIMMKPRTRYPPRIFVRIADELAVLYHSHPPPEHLRGHLERLLVFLGQRGDGIDPTRVVLSIMGRLPDYFQPRFFMRFCDALIRHRQFAATGRLITAIRTMHPKVGRSLRFLLNRVAMRTRMSRAIKRTLPASSLHGPASLRLSSRLRRCSHVGPLLEHMVQKLLASGRVLAAKDIFARGVHTLSPKQCTAVGNILLHGVSCRPILRNGRRVRKVLALLEHLAKNHGFHPDRVTVNIVIKVLIGWRRAFDASRLRGLFDQLIRGGYPAGDYSPQHPPFATAWVETSSSFHFPMLQEFISFERHIRPLFKMFIKAFYLRHDIDAARKVVGILKVEEYKNAAEKWARRRARQQGRIRALRRNGGHVGQLDSSQYLGMD